MGTRFWTVVALACGAVSCLPVTTMMIPADPSARPEPLSRGQAVTVAPVLAVTETVRRRLDGECYVSCRQGYQCEPKSGLCEEIPCGGTCGEAETCVGTGTRARCVALTAIPSKPFVVTSAPSP